MVIAAAVVACAPAPAAQPAAKPAAEPAKPAVAAQPPSVQPAAKPAEPVAKPAQPAAKPAPAQKEAAKPAAAPSGQKLRMLFGSSAPPSSYYVHAVALSKLWNTKVPEVEVTNVEAAGCLEHLRRMDSGQFLVGISCPDLTYQAWHGLGQFKDKPAQVQRFLIIHTVAPLALMVRKDTPITKLEDLEGKDWAPSSRASGSESVLLNVMPTLGIKPKYYGAGMADMVQAAQDRRIVGFAKLQAAPKVIDSATQEVNLKTPLRMLGFTPEQEKTVTAKFPFYSFMTVERDALAAGFPEQTLRTVAQVVGASIHKDVPEDIGYKLAKVSIEDNTAKGDQSQAMAYPAIKGADFAQLTVDFALTPLHAGAVKYLREIGKQIKPEQMPPEMK
ncbi:MAG: TAXI family TRAP transporter solute-binding subunit [Chloroflexi bacterium]|nr:TAXI family TRAP transporter solute-binding subunit [Chloroflexota bacterium]